MLFYSENNGPRLQYAISEFCRRAGIKEWKLTNSPTEFEQRSVPGINYSCRHFPDSLQIIPSGFLEETGYRNFIPSVSKSEKWKIIIFPDNESAEIPFDIFSGIFYFLSRYEEYSDFIPDQHSRFSSGNSLAHVNDFLDMPLIEYWIREIKIILSQNFSSFRFTNPVFKFTCTFDIDNAFAFKAKGFVRNLGASIKSLLKGKSPGLIRRIGVIRNVVADPYDTYSWIFSQLKKFEMRAIWFFLLSDKSEYDRNISWKNPQLKNLIKEISREFETGIHPSYSSFRKAEQVNEEINRLNAITGAQVIHSRQHYLRLHIPQTYQALENSGIKHDYTMGYADQTGFRASTCFPFYFYDLTRERISSLLIHPLVLMDGTLNEYMHLTPDEAKEVSGRIISEIKMMQGECIILWHNETLNNEGRWMGWQEVFIHQLNCARN